VIRQQRPIWTWALSGLTGGHWLKGTLPRYYAVHGPDHSLAFIALWYGLTIALCTALGAFVGPRLLRW